MNRFKKEIRRKGIKLEADYPWLPYFIKGSSIFERGYIFVDGVTVKMETATIYRYLNIGVEVITMKRNGNLETDLQ